MDQTSYSAIISDQTERALWEVGNVISCIPHSVWNDYYYAMPLWKHVYHMLHSLDLWFINPRDKNFVEPSIHEVGLNSLDEISSKRLDRAEAMTYFEAVRNKTMGYVAGLEDKELMEMPMDCEYTKFTLIVAQLRHLHTHMGMLMGFIVAKTGSWPYIVGLENEIPTGGFGIFDEH
ncbi:MAG: hypothetical protein LUG13_00585 [Oscillospiraceae bacterium]|nr:hypothetical protein [Oscillospiraceae bacterium]